MPTPNLAEVEERRRRLLAHEQRVRALFERLDVNGDGNISKVEMIKALKTDPEAAALLELPRHIRQEDGTRDSFEARFQAMDRNDSRSLDWNEFWSYFKDMPLAPQHAAAPAAASRASGGVPPTTSAAAHRANVSTVAPGPPSTPSGRNPFAPAATATVAPTSTVAAGPKLGFNPFAEGAAGAAQQSVSGVLREEALMAQAAQLGGYSPEDLEKVQIQQAIFRSLAEAPPEQQQRPTPLTSEKLPDLIDFGGEDITASTTLQGRAAAAPAAPASAPPATANFDPFAPSSPDPFSGSDPFAQPVRSAPPPNPFAETTPPIAMVPGARQGAQQPPQQQNNPWTGVALAPAVPQLEGGATMADPNLFADLLPKK